MLSTRRTIFQGTAAVLLGVLVMSSGCGRHPEVVTADLQGRRVNAFEVEGDWMVYTWAPAQAISTPTHLVVRNLRTGEETELVADYRLSIGFAIDHGRIVYPIRNRGGGNEPVDVVMYDTASRSKKTVLQAPVRRFDLSGDYLVCEHGPYASTTVVLFNVSTGERRNLSAQAGTDGQANIFPRIDGQTVAWTVHDRALGQYQLCLYDIDAGRATPTPVIHPNRFKTDLSGDHLVYWVARGNDRMINLYEISRGTDRVIACGPRLHDNPSIAGHFVAWSDHIPKDEFKPVPGQPLYDEKDYRNLYVHDIRSGRTTQIASSVFEMFRHRVTEDGCVYAAVQREMTDRRKSNLNYGVDVWRW